MFVCDIQHEHGISRSSVYRLPLKSFKPIGSHRYWLRADVDAHFRTNLRDNRPVAPVDIKSMRPAPAPSSLDDEWGALADEMGL